MRNIFPSARGTLARGAFARRLTLAAALMIVGTGLAACDDDDPAAPVPVATTLSVMSGNAQETTPNTAIAAPLVVELKDQYGDPLASQSVTWAISNGTGALSSTTSTTDTNGQASVTYTPDDNTGITTITATVGALTPVDFTVNVVPST